MDSKYKKALNAALEKEFAWLEAFIAILIFAICGCAAAIVVTWNESQNHSQGTLDVEFNVKAAEAGDFERTLPNVPDGYSISKETKSNSSCEIEYGNEAGSTIIYSQDSYVKNMSLSIDNENAEISEIKVNGCKGYSYKKKGIAMLIWTDGIYLYTLQGNCPMEILEEMNRSLAAREQG